MTQTSNASIRRSVIMVRWALIIACAYMILFSDAAPASIVGPLVIAGFLGSNIIVGRLPLAQFGTRGFKVAIGAIDTVFIALTLYASRQLSIEVLVLFLGVVVLAAAGLELAVIARMTIALAVADLLVVWLTGSPVWRSSMMLRVPFLLSAGLVYGALVEAGLTSSSDTHRSPLVAIDALTAGLAMQRDAIARCQVAMGTGAAVDAQSALVEIAGYNQDMQAKLARV